MTKSIEETIQQVDDKMVLYGILSRHKAADKKAKAAAPASTPDK